MERYEIGSIRMLKNIQTQVVILAYGFASWPSKGFTSDCISMLAKTKYLKYHKRNNQKDPKLIFLKFQYCSTSHPTTPLIILISTYQLRCICKIPNSKSTSYYPYMTLTSMAEPGFSNGWVEITTGNYRKII
jgi:hypothetical protein